jgi:hypothetical protein
VPINAKWHGGADGGAWFVVNEANSENHFILEVYNDYEGSLLAKGEFMLNSDCIVDSVLSVEDIKKSIDAWTGETAMLNIVGKNKQYCSLIYLDTESAMDSYPSKTVVTPVFTPVDSKKE